MAGAAIEISDDDITESEVEFLDETHITPENPPKRRKLDVFAEEKVTWTDDSDDETEKLQRIRAARRTSKRGRKSKVSASTTSRKKKDPAEPDKDEYEEAEAPQYLRQRRKRFDRDRKLLKDAGLKLPPDYGDLYFSDDDRLSKSLA